MTRRDQLAQRLTHIPPTDLERDPVGVVVCELLADLLDALSGGVEQGPADTSTGQNPDDGREAVPAPSDTTTGGEGGAVLLQEPDLPPDDGAGINDTRDGAVAGQAAATAGKTGRPPRRKTATAKTPAKNTPPAQ